MNLTEAIEATRRLAEAQNEYPAIATLYDVNRWRDCVASAAEDYPAADVLRMLERLEQYDEDALEAKEERQ